MQNGCPPHKPHIGCRYTSLDGRNDTHQNPALQKTDKGGGSGYLPAYMLGDGSLERAGRN